MFLLILYSLISRINPNASEKQRSWYLTFVVSLLLSVEGYFVVIPKLLDNVTNVTQFAFSTFKRSEFISYFFIDYCISDIILALIGVYNLRFFEGWCHHIFYISLISILRYNNYSNAFWMFLWCEIPTFFLAIQNLFNLRLPFFSFVFFVFRVLIFSIVLILFFFNLPWSQYIYTLPPALIILSIHVVWCMKLCAPHNTKIKLAKDQ